MAKKDNELEFAAGASNSEKLKALQAAMDKIEKSFGKGSIMKLGDEKIQDVEVIPTGSVALNYALGVGGYPKGRIIEIYGPESSGKTTLAIHAIAEAQKAGGIAAFIDAEHAFDRFYAAKLGVDVDNVWISQPDNGEQALEIAEHDTNLFTQLVDEDTGGVGLADGRCQLSQCLRHQACLQAYLVVTHVTFDFGLRSQCGYRVNHDDVDGR